MRHRWARALQRLERRGREDWERRTLAIEGLADIGGKQAVDTILSLALEGPAPLRQRASAALGKMAEYIRPDPCVPSALGALEGTGRGGASEWSRPIRALGQVCATRLSAAEAQALALRLVPLLSDPNPHVREQTSEALGRIASRAAAPALQQLLRDPYLSKT